MGRRSIGQIKPFKGRIESFSFYGSFWDQIYLAAKNSDDVKVGKLLAQTVNYGLEGEMIGDESYALTGLESAIFIGIQKQLDASRFYYKAGKDKSKESENSKGGS
jgi:hypothetical protein